MVILCVMWTSASLGTWPGHQTCFIQMDKQPVRNAKWILFIWAGSELSAWSWKAPASLSISWAVQSPRKTINNPLIWSDNDCHDDQSLLWIKTKDWIGLESCIPSIMASVAMKTLLSLCLSMRLRIFFTAAWRLGTSSLWPQMKSFLLRWTPRYGPPTAVPSFTYQRTISTCCNQNTLAWTQNEKGLGTWTLALQYG